MTAGNDVPAGLAAASTRSAPRSWRGEAQERSSTR